MNNWLDRMQIVCSARGSLGISNDVINFWEQSMKNKMADNRHFGWISFKFYVL